MKESVDSAASLRRDLARVRLLSQLAVAIESLFLGLASAAAIGIAAWADDRSFASRGIGPAAALVGTGTALLWVGMRNRRKALTVSGGAELPTVELLATASAILSSQRQGMPLSRLCLEEIARRLPFSPRLGFSHFFRSATAIPAVFAAAFLFAAQAWGGGGFLSPGEGVWRDLLAVEQALEKEIPEGSKTLRASLHSLRMETEARKDFASSPQQAEQVRQAHRELLDLQSKRTTEKQSPPSPALLQSLDRALSRLEKEMVAFPSQSFANASPFGGEKEGGTAASEAKTIEDGSAGAMKESLGRDSQTQVSSAYRIPAGFEDVVRRYFERASR